eukprot:scaffold10238_cov276-Chaetoceros_neogracile.AAC.10
MDLSPTEAGFWLQWHMVLTSERPGYAILNYRRNAANVKNTLKENEIFIEVYIHKRATTTTPARFDRKHASMSNISIISCRDIMKFV